MPAENFSEESFVLYINYFGLCENNVEILEKKYKNLIVDNTQSFYSPPKGLASFSSLRKFFKVQNGAYLYLKDIPEVNFETDKSNFTPYLIHENYEKFLKNELYLNTQDIKSISPYVEAQMNDFNYDEDKKQRVELFEKYSEIFDKYNVIKFQKPENIFPYCYPFSGNNSKIADKITGGNIILLRLWKDIPKSFPEYKILNNTAALPLNDRKFAERIIDIFSSL